VKNTIKDFKKGDRVKWKIGRATSYLHGVVLKTLDRGGKIPHTPKLKSQTYDGGNKTMRAAVLIRLKDGTVRLLAPGYLKAVK
jgi:hypothetical protein